MCQSVSSFYTCNCAGENYIQQCKYPSLNCVERLQAPQPVSLNVTCLKHISRPEGKAAKASSKERDPYYPPTSFTKKLSRQLSNSQLNRRKSNRSTIPPKTPTSTYPERYRASTSSSVYSDASVASSMRSRSARPRAESYAALLDLGPLSLEQSTSLAEARSALRHSVELENKSKSIEAKVFDTEIASIVSRRPSQRIRQTILNVVERRPVPPQSNSRAMDPIPSPRTANTHPTLRHQLSPRPRHSLRDRKPIASTSTPPLSPATLYRDVSMREKAARIRASLNKERNIITNLDRRPAGASVQLRSPIKKSPVQKKREYNSWAGYPSHARSTRNADRMPQAPESAYQRPPSSRVSYGYEETILEDDVNAINRLTEMERYELFLEKDRRRTVVDRQKRAARRARGGMKGDLRGKSDGICSVM